MTAPDGLEFSDPPSVGPRPRMRAITLKTMPNNFDEADGVLVGPEVEVPVAPTNRGGDVTRLPGFRVEWCAKFREFVASVPAIRLMVAGMTLDGAVKRAQKMYAGMAAQEKIS